MRKIAVIEDTQDNRDLLYYLLREEFEVAGYSTGEEALRAFAEDRPDLIIVDIWLPGMSGVEVLGRLRQDSELVKIPVVALTAEAMSGAREKYLAAGFDEYVSKPIVDLDQFSGTLRRLIGATNPPR
jgi:CheY-like chemotaxis protein